ncbi:chloride channel protein [Flavobacterium sp. 7A]|uniref:chloride channel protein n=1 Tax=Flavobacterium sp. 7A TaxID=2940571 RepID=UPI0022264E22|nr:chloride channel protein [Flavobacterium sp. 7A]MCW2119487.1 CIC family chloride channel protein [Flavobacterium sp. 7A]
MTKTATIKKNYHYIIFRKLVLVSILIGFLSCFLGILLKNATEYYEGIFFERANANIIFYLVFPFMGFSTIYFLRQYLFKKKENKGIKEVFESTDSKSKNLPNYKIPSHFINGFLTVIFGGSTGIEISTVVATATIGSVAQQKKNFFRQYKTELICAGVAAGITALFGSPIAGLLFAYEVISKKVSQVFILTTGIAVAIAFGLLNLINEPPLFAINISTWHLKAIPYFILLGILAGMNAVYLTKSVLFIKGQFLKINTHFYKIILGSVILSASLILFPELYGEGYHSIKAIINTPTQISLTVSVALSLVALLILKPIVTSITLASGGDGGVFAPSLFIGAFLGLLTGLCLNHFFNSEVIVLNFMVLGMAAVLSASIDAPFTALFLTLGLTNNYVLFVPILIVCFVSKYTAKMIFPHTVYTFIPNTTK